MTRLRRCHGRPLGLASLIFVRDKGFHLDKRSTHQVEGCCIPPLKSGQSGKSQSSLVNCWLLWLQTCWHHPTPGTYCQAEFAKLPRKRLAVNLWKCRGHIGPVGVDKATLANHPRVCAGDASCQLAILIHICMEFGHAETIIQTCGAELALCVRGTSQSTFSVPNFWLVLPSWTGLAKKRRRSEVVSLQANAIRNRGAL